MFTYVGRYEDFLWEDSDDEDKHYVHDDDDDSNDENNWRNDYPDEDDRLESRSR